MHMDKNKKMLFVQGSSVKLIIWRRFGKKKSLNNSIKAKRSHFGPLFVIPVSSRATLHKKLSKQSTAYLGLC